MITILLIDHSFDCERNVRSVLSALPADSFQIEHGTGYRAILQGFRSQSADVCVIDSCAGNELKLLAQARSLRRSLPIIVVTDNDANTVVAAIRNGAADCLLRDQLTPANIERSICCVVEQARSAALQSERERRYLALFDSVEEIIYTHDLENNITSMNPAGLRILGYALPEISKLEVSAIVDVASQPTVSGAIKLLLDAQMPTMNKVRLVMKSGEPLIVEMNAHPIYQQGKPVEVQVLARVITKPRALTLTTTAILSIPIAGQHRFHSRPGPPDRAPPKNCLA
jgi:PAS domain S-box-containing protein